MNYQDMLEILLNEEMKDIDLDPIATAIEDMASQDYWQSKNERLSGLLTSEEVARILVQETLGFGIQIQELIGRIATKISKDIPYKDMVRNATNVIEAAENLVYEIKLGDVIMVNSFYKLEAATYEYTDLRRYEPPMLMEPNQWVVNDDGGYYANDLHCILGSIHSRHDKPQALDMLNKLQAISWELCPLILEYEEIPNKDFVSPESHEQFKTMAIDSRNTYMKYVDKPFWFIWQFDKRGRMYSRGYHINLQSSGYKKALLNFASKSLITGDI
jgi:DNA-directed RNA polymerase